MHLTAAERDRYDTVGYVLREGAFSEAELEQLRGAVEEAATHVAEHARRSAAGPAFRLADGHRLQLSSGTVIQWEWREGSPEIRLLEPFTHLHPEFAALWDDERFLAPMQSVFGGAVGPFTDKLNLKRPREGSPFPWHQDYPYWYVRTPRQAHEIATAMLFLDDADAGNGALRVLPGSHRAPFPRDRSEPTQFLADASRIDERAEEIVPARAGSILFFGAWLVHRSAPNHSDRERRAMLLSFQPAGRPRHEALEWRPHLVAELP